MTHPDNELRRRLWALADEWESRPGTTFAKKVDEDFVRELRQALTYPEATEADEAALQAAYGKTADELADEAETGWWQ